MTIESDFLEHLKKTLDSNLQSNPHSSQPTPPQSKQCDVVVQEIDSNDTNDLLRNDSVVDICADHSIDVSSSVDNVTGDDSPLFAIKKNETFDNLIAELKLVQSKRDESLAADDDDHSMVNTVLATVDKDNSITDAVHQAPLLDNKTHETLPLSDTEASNLIEKKELNNQVTQPIAKPISVDTPEVSEALKEPPKDNEAQPSSILISKEKVEVNIATTKNDDTEELSPDTTDKTPNDSKLQINRSSSMLNVQVAPSPSNLIRAESMYTVASKLKRGISFQLTSITEEKKITRNIVKSKMEFWKDKMIKQKKDL